MRSQLFGMRQTIQQGVRFMISSDAGVRFTRFEDLYLSLKVAVHGLGLSPMEAIVAATGIAAEALGLGDELGTVVAGKRADLLIVEGDPLSNLETLQQVRWVFRDGRVVSQDGLLKLT
jgi:imidazolonepropionase-like amidohydrolase